MLQQKFHQAGMYPCMMLRERECVFRARHACGCGARFVCLQQELRSWSDPDAGELMHCEYVEAHSNGQGPGPDGLPCAGNPVLPFIQS